MITRTELRFRVDPETLRPDGMLGIYSFKDGAETGLAIDYGSPEAMLADIERLRRQLMIAMELRPRGVE